LIRVIFESCKERLRPELITLLMKTLGLVPMVLSKDEAASMWRSLGLTVLFGTITGSILTLFIVPVAYLSMEKATHYVEDTVPQLWRSLCDWVGQWVEFLLSKLRLIYSW
ncbi:MAG: efflux RND transporter permease subunit, partial [Endomicrobiales bacterium]